MPDTPTYRVGAHEFTDPEYARMEEYAQGIGLGAYRPDPGLRCQWTKPGGAQCLGRQGHIGEHQYPAQETRTDA